MHMSPKPTSRAARDRPEQVGLVLAIAMAAAVYAIFLYTIVEATILS